MTAFQAAVVLMPHPNGGWVAFKHEEGWNLPGGKVEAGESPRFAAFRECVEEVGVTPTHLHPFGVVRHTHGGVQWDVHLFFAPMPRSESPTTEDGTVLDEGVISEQLQSGRFPEAIPAIFQKFNLSEPARVMWRSPYDLWREKSVSLVSKWRKEHEREEG